MSLKSLIRVVKFGIELLPFAKEFDCGDDDLNDFIRNDALKYLDGKIAVTYLLLCDTRILGFFCLSNDSVELKGKEKKHLKDKGKSQKTYPAVKIGRLGVSKDDWDKGFGTMIIETVVGMALDHSERIGCRYLTVDAYNKKRILKFYEKNEFRPLVQDPDNDNVPMCLDLLKAMNHSTGVSRS